MKTAASIRLITSIGGSLAALLTSIYQWSALYEMRTLGKAPVCSVSAQLDCGTIWNSPWSTWVHANTGVPFAGWGVVFAVIALALSLDGIWRQRSTSVLALRGVTLLASLGTLALLAYSVNMGIFCPTCLLFYVCVWMTTFAAWQTQATAAEPLKAALTAVGAFAVGALLAVYPGMKTPLPNAMTLPIAKTTTVPAPAPAQTPAKATQTAPENAAATAPPGGELEKFLGEANQDMKQALSDGLDLYRKAQWRGRPTDEKRLTFGSSGASVQLVEWVDLLCPHCARFHQALDQIIEATPGKSWNLETHYYPLDSECNPGIQRTDGTGVHCLAAKVLICSAGQPDEHQLRSALFANQASLKPELVWQLSTKDDAEKRAALEHCVNSQATQDALANDVADADAYGIRGTPFLVINGRPAPGLPLLLYALILAGGDPMHAAFDNLPTPRPPPPEQ